MLKHEGMNQVISRHFHLCRTRHTFGPSIGLTEQNIQYPSLALHSLRKDDDAADEDDDDDARRKGKELRTIKSDGKITNSATSKPSVDTDFFDSSSMDVDASVHPLFVSQLSQARKRGLTTYRKKRKEV